MVGIEEVEADSWVNWSWTGSWTGSCSRVFHNILGSSNWWSGENWFSEETRRTDPTGELRFLLENMDQEHRWKEEG